ncbi:MAG: hypothetical protein H7222_06410 [Methylotenera sp.]|nr:hypothetical protein [Oligoflexia bacterium]
MSRNESGQAVIEYVLLISIIASAFVIVGRGLVDMGLAQKLTRPLREEFARTYQYGHPKGKGFEDGGPDHHPRAMTGGTNGRMFLNPRDQ